MSRYTSKSIRVLVLSELDRLLVPWFEDRPPNFSCSMATKELVATSCWLSEELVRLGVNDADRITQLGKYHRQSRSYDVFEAATECLNEVLDGTVEQNRKPHRRWG